MSWRLDTLLPLSHSPIPLKPTLQIVDDALGYVAHSSASGLSVLTWEVHSTPSEVDVAKTHSNEFSNAAPQFVNRPHHQLVLVIVNA